MLVESGLAPIENVNRVVFILGDDVFDGSVSVLSVRFGVVGWISREREIGMIADIIETVNIIAECGFSDSGHVEAHPLGCGVHVGIDAEVDPLFLTHSSHTTTVACT
jgi:hypothetical protein